MSSRMFPLNKVYTEAGDGRTDGRDATLNATP